MLQAWGLSEKGSVRATNEDRFAIDEDLQLCVVADGMGGHNAGEIAAHTAVDAVLDVLHDRPRLGWPFGFDPSLSEGGNLIRTAIYLANMRVLETAGSSSAYTGMGTTLVAALVADGRLSVGHVGDSRLYRLADGRLRQLTGDDSWVATMIANDPRADASLLQNHPMRHVLTNVVGSRRHTEVHVVEEPMHRFLDHVHVRRRRLPTTLVSTCRMGWYCSSEASARGSLAIMVAIHESSPVNWRSRPSASRYRRLSPTWPTDRRPSTTSAATSVVPMPV